MKTTVSNRGFRFIKKGEGYVVSESSAIGDYEDSDLPGSSYLWVGEVQLDREEVGRLCNALTHWLENKRLPILGNFVPGSRRTEPGCVCETEDIMVCPIHCQ